MSFWGLRGTIEGTDEVVYLCWSTTPGRPARWSNDVTRAVRYLSERQARSASWDYGRPELEVEIFPIPEA